MTKQRVLSQAEIKSTSETGQAGGFEPTAHATIVRMKRMMVWSIALLWLLDAGLQAQPRMFTLDFISNIMTPSVAISPSIFANLANWTIALITPNIGEWNWLFTTVQFAIAIALLVELAGKNEWVTKGELILSIVWGLGVWVVGEGTSGVFTGNGTLLTGAPGSVLLYVLIAAFYFLPDRWWNLNARFCLPRDALALVFLYGVVAQVLIRPFWGEQGIPSLLQGQTAMAPSWMVSTLSSCRSAHQSSSSGVERRLYDDDARHRHPDVRATPARCWLCCAGRHAPRGVVLGPGTRRDLLWNGN